MKLLCFGGIVACTLFLMQANAAEPAANEPISLDRDGIIALVSEHTTECRKEKDGSLCSNYFSEDGVIKRVMHDDGKRRDGVWFVDDQERLCILWQGKIKPLCLIVYEQQDGSFKLVKRSGKHVSTIVDTESGNVRDL